MLAPINAYLGSALIIIALGMALVGLSGGHMGGHVDISVMRDGGDVSVRVQEGQMPEGVMREDIPGPRTAEEVRNDPNLADWREGAVLAWVPVIAEKGRPRRINISLDAGLLEAIDQETHRRGMTRSAFLSSAARREITQS